MYSRRPSAHGLRTSYQSTTFDRDVEIRVHETVGSASVSPSGRDVVLASAEGLHIIDLDSPYSAPRFLSHQQQWPPADVQWSPFASRDYWIVSTSNQKALVWNLEQYSASSPIQYTLHAHSRAITDINFSAHHPDMLATCSVDSFVHCWDLRRSNKPVMTFANWTAGATQVKWNRQDEHILASSHDRFLYVWDDRMGAKPLKTIEAHTTKIYGIDWNRTRSTGILTCSLDKSIKLWDYANGEDKPERVIRTPYPIWRARHTPFGWGVIALPQRGDNDLHLYDRRLSEGVPRVGYVEPVHSFSAHQSNVKEFLWRSRGSIDNGIDERDFQLISWGMDRVLHLHRIDPQVLKSVGYEKGKQVRKNMLQTRQGADYRTFNTYKLGTPQEEVKEQPIFETKGLLGKLVSAAGMSKMLLPVAPINRDQSSMTYSGKLRKRTADPIKWMQGVTMRSRSDTISRSHFGLDNPESLKDEITTVSQKYTKVNFEIADVHGRTAKVTLNGPWGPDEKPTFMRVNFEFPSDYPSVAPAICTLEKTAGGIPDDVMERLNEEMKSIVAHYQTRKLGCLEAVITYLLGERGLEESITLPQIDGAFDFPSPHVDESSSDDDDDADAGPSQDLETSAEGPGMGLASANANMPLPRGTGAYWSFDGRLVCFFPPKPEPKPLFSLDTLRTAAGDKSSKGHRLFENFGRLQEESPISKRAAASQSQDDEALDSDSAESWTSSSSSSSDDSFEDITRLPSHFRPPVAWRAATLRVQKSSSHSGSGGAGVTSKRSTTTAPPKPKSYISIHDLSEMLPAKRELAKEYEVFGDGAVVCAHNADVARKYGYIEAAATWDVCKHILYGEVPLEILDQNERREPILIQAKRSMVKVRRKDSGLDLAFDEPANVSKPLLTGRVKWGKHPFAGTWLIPQLFDYYERLGDVQMCGMLACIFCEPAAREGITNAMSGVGDEDLPVEMRAPGFSLDYFPSVDVAWSQYRNPADPVHIQSATPGGPRSAELAGYFDERITTFGSANSSNGPWVPDTVQNSSSGPQTPYSMDDISVAESQPRSHRSSFPFLSSSPDTSHRMSATESAISIFKRERRQPQSEAPSPTTQERFRAPEADLSTSAPPSGVTWGSTTFFPNSLYKSPYTADNKRRRSSSRRSLLTSWESEPEEIENVIEFSDNDSDIDSDSFVDIGRSVTPIPKVKQSRQIDVTLKNQHLFDDEGHPAVPLLPPTNSPKYEVFRSMYASQLSAWGLHIQKAEIEKFNGFTSYWPSGDGPPIPAIPYKFGRGLEEDEKRGSGAVGEIVPIEEKEKRIVPGSKNCHICLEKIKGLYVECPSGWHRAHTKCQLWDGGVSCGCALTAEDEDDFFLEG